MKKLLITRALPEATLAAARARFDVTLRPQTAGLTVAEAAAALAAPVPEPDIFGGAMDTGVEESRD